MGLVLEGYQCVTIHSQGASVYIPTTAAVIRGFLSLRGLRIEKVMIKASAKRDFFLEITQWSTFPYPDLSPDRPPSRQRGRLQN